MKHNQRLQYRQAPIFETESLTSEVSGSAMV